MKIIKSLGVGVALGFAVGFTTEIVMQITKADDNTRKKVNKVTSTVMTAGMIATLII